MGAPAWIRPDEGFSVRKCIISDISATGVRLYIDAEHSTMKKFSLLMSRKALQGCPCRVKWRRGTQIGAEFLWRQGAANVPTFDPNAPYANSNGIVASPNVNPANEVVQQLIARYTFAMNAAVARSYEQMMKSLLDIKT